MKIEYGNLPFNEAIKFFQKKGFAISPDSWRDVWQQAHARAFTVARVTAMDVLSDIREEVRKALDEGISLGQFKKDLRETLTRKGWFAPKGEEAIVELPDGTTRKRLTGWRLETIFRVNLQTAYSTGRYKQMTEVKNRRPYWQYMSLRLSTSREDHIRQHGKVYHADHPFWDTWYPPNGFECKCYVKTLSTRQMDNRGLKEEKRGVGVKPDEGWQYNVGKAPLDSYKPDLTRYEPEARKQLEKDLWD